jgi:hypothetical protein
VLPLLTQRQMSNDSICPRPNSPYLLSQFDRTTANIGSSQPDQSAAAMMITTEMTTTKTDTPLSLLFSFSGLASLVSSLDAGGREPDLRYILSGDRRILLKRD